MSPQRGKPVPNLNHPSSLAPFLIMTARDPGSLVAPASLQLPGGGQKLPGTAAVLYWRPALQSGLTGCTAWLRSHTVPSGASTARKIQIGHLAASRLKVKPCNAVILSRMRTMYIQMRCGSGCEVPPRYARGAKYNSHPFHSVGKRLLLLPTPFRPLP